MSLDTGRRVRGQKLLLLALAILAPIATLLVVNSLEEQVANLDWSNDTLRGAVFQGAATIAGLAIFGSAITVRFYREPFSKSIQKWLSLYVYGGITVLVAVQGMIMVLSCCLDITTTLLATYASATTISLLWVGAFLTITLVRQKNERELVSESLRLELENTYQIVSRTENTMHGQKQYNEQKYLNHDVYDSLLATGWIVYINRDGQQIIQNIVNAIKLHNKQLKQIERAVLDDEVSDNVHDEVHRRIFVHRRRMRLYDKRILQDIGTAIKYLE